MYISQVPTEVLLVIKNFSFKLHLSIYVCEQHIEVREQLA